MIFFSVVSVINLPSRHENRPSPPENTNAVLRQGTRWKNGGQATTVVFLRWHDPGQVRGYDLSPGLYEVSEQGAQRYLLVWLKRDGTIGRSNPDADRVRAMATLMDHGQDFEAARRATRAAVAAPQQ